MSSYSGSVSRRLKNQPETKSVNEWSMVCYFFYHVASGLCWSLKRVFQTKVSDDGAFWWQLDGGKTTGNLWVSGLFLRFEGSFRHTFKDIKDIRREIFFSSNSYEFQYRYLSSGILGFTIFLDFCYSLLFLDGRTICMYRCLNISREA